jgi:hypothetical protein
LLQRRFAKNNITPTSPTIAQLLPVFQKSTRARHVPWFGALGRLIYFLTLLLLFPPLNIGPRPSVQQDPLRLRTALSSTNLFKITPLKMSSNNMAEPHTSRPAYTTGFPLDDVLDTHLEVINILSPPEQNTECYICQEMYCLEQVAISKPHYYALTYLDALPFPQHKNMSRDEPVRLPCNHIIGSICLEEWLQVGGTSCPLYRADVFPVAKESSPFNYKEYNRRLEEITRIDLRTLLKSPLLMERNVYLSVPFTQSIIRQLPGRFAQMAFRVNKLTHPPAALKCHQILRSEIQDGKDITDRRTSGSVIRTDLCAFQMVSGQRHPVDHFRGPIR